MTENKTKSTSEPVDHFVAGIENSRRRVDALIALKIYNVGALLSHLFYRLKESKQHMVPVGIIDDQEKLVFVSQVFIDKKPSFYSFSNKTYELTEVEIFEMYSSSQEQTQNKLMHSDHQTATRFGGR